jgi:hypothetical protein
MQPINYPRNNEVWTPEESRRLIQLTQSGKSYSDLALIFQRRTEAIRNHYNALSKVYAPPSSQPIPGSLWQKQEEDTLLKLYHEKCSMHTIAKTLGRSVAACRTKIYDLIPTPLKMPSSKPSVEASLNQDPVNHGKPWLPEDTAKLLELGDQSSDWKQIAIQLGRKANSVEQKYKHLKRLIKSDTGDFHRLFQENAGHQKRDAKPSSIDSPSKRTKTHHVDQQETAQILLSFTTDASNIF